MKYLKVISVIIIFVFVAPLATILKWADWATEYKMSEVLQKLFNEERGE